LIKSVRLIGLIGFAGLNALPDPIDLRPDLTRSDPIDPIRPVQTPCP
jgi:hypothetical protein